MKRKIETRQDEKEAESHAPLHMTRRGFVLTGAGAAISATLPMGCGGDKETTPNQESIDQATRGTPWAGTQKILDLAENVHLADINHYGEFLDFGTSARFKYSLGGWMSGWNNDTSMNGVSFTWASKSPSRLYFSVLEATPLTFVIRAKKGGTSAFSVYLNDNPLRRVTFKGDDWEEHRIEAPVESVVAGENYLKFIYSTAEKTLGDAPASFGVDYVRILKPGEDTPAGTPFDAPQLDALVVPHKIKDKELRSLILATPVSLSYYADIPKGTLLCFSAAPIPPGGADKKGMVNIAVRVTPVDGGPRKELLKKDFDRSDWHEEMIDLAPVHGKLSLVEIEISGSKGGRVALGEPALRLNPPKIEPSNKKIKNAIVVLIDTLRADKLGVYKKNRVKTSALEKFTNESTLFEQCQAPSNWTKPSCGSVLTGMYPDTHKARGHTSRVAASIKLASEVFMSSGFATGAFIANGYLATEFGFNRGWTEYVNFIRENKNTDAENVFQKSLDFIGKNKDKPFFTYVQTIDPHVPYDPPDDYLKMYDKQGYDGPVRNRSTGNLLEDFKRKKVELSTRDRRRLEALYDGEITYHDTYFGHFLDGLNKLGVLDETMIIVCSDHGEEFFDHDSVGHGHTLHQELLHVPLIVRAPGVVPQKKRTDAPSGLTDILPTLLAATDVPAPKELEGRNLISVCNGAISDPLDAAFSSFYSEADGRNLSWTVCKGGFKLRMKGPAVTYLYNLKDDPRELTDVDVKYPLALRALRIALGQFIGSPNKKNWSTSEIASHSVGKPKAKDEEADVPEDLKAQLRALGYLN